MAILRIIHLPLGEGEVGVWVEPRDLEILGEYRPIPHVPILAEICIVIGHHQHIEGDDEQEGDDGEEPLFLFYLKDIVHMVCLSVLDCDAFALSLQKYSFFLNIPNDTSYFMSFDKKKGVLLGVISELVYLCGSNLS